MLEFLGQSTGEKRLQCQIPGVLKMAPVNIQQSTDQCVQVKKKLSKDEKTTNQKDQREQCLALTQAWE